MPPRRGARSPSETWVPGSAPTPEDGIGAAALERLRELTGRPEPEIPERVSDDLAGLSLSELGDELHSRAEAMAGRELPRSPYDEGDE